MKLAAVGDNCMDLYVQQNQAFPGGNPLNVSVYFVRLGGVASYTGVVGNDKNGEIMRSTLAEKGVDISHLRVMKGATAVTYVELIDGERVFGDYFEGVLADFKLTDEDIDFLCEHDMVVSGFWGMIENDLDKIKARGATIAFDFATKLHEPLVDQAIPFVDYAFFAYDDDDEDALKAYMIEQHRKGPKLVVATLGEKGSICFDGTMFHTFGIIPCNVVDTMGAGDSYIAGFLYGVLQHLPIVECMKLGAANSSQTIQYMGAW